MSTTPADDEKRLRRFVRLLSCNKLVTEKDRILCRQSLSILRLSFTCYERSTDCQEAARNSMYVIRRLFGDKLTVDDSIEQLTKFGSKVNHQFYFDPCWQGMVGGPWLNRCV